MFLEYVDGDYAHVRIGYRPPAHIGLSGRFAQKLTSKEVYRKLHASPGGEARESLQVFHRYNTEVLPYWRNQP